MGAHAVSAAVGRPVVSVAKLFGRDVVDLRKRRRRRKCERDFIDERNYMISGRGDCGKRKCEMTNGWLRIPTLTDLIVTDACDRSARKKEAIV